LDVVDSSTRPRSTSEVVISPDEPALSSTSRTQDGRQRARSWIAGGAAVLLGFALTAFWMGNRRAQPAASNDVAPAAVAPVVAEAAGPTATVVPVVVPSASAVAAQPAVKPSGNVPQAPPIKERHPSSSAKPKPATGGAKVRAAVAPGLELSTREP
jgi:hypothetical protein